LSFKITSEQDATEVTDLADPIPGSAILARLRKQAQRQQEEKSRDFAVGGDFGEWLRLRFTPLRPEAVDDFINRRMGDDVKALEMNMDLITFCVAVVGYNPETREEEILMDDEGKPIRLTHELVRLLELPIPPGPPLTSRDVVMIIFGGNGMAIGNFGDRVISWMQNPTENKSVGEA
jgi:hypothetical protein